MLLWRLGTELSHVSPLEVVNAFVEKLARALLFFFFDLQRGGNKIQVPHPRLSSKIDRVRGSEEDNLRKAALNKLVQARCRGQSDDNHAISTGTSVKYTMSFRKT